MHSYTSNCVGLFLIVYYRFPLYRAHYATIFRKRLLKTNAISFLPLVKTLCCYFRRIRELIIWHYSLLNIYSILLGRIIWSLAVIIGRLKQLNIFHLWLIPRILLIAFYLTLVISSSTDTFSPGLFLIRWILFLRTYLSTWLTLFCISRCWTILVLRVNWTGCISSHSNGTLMIYVIDTWWTSYYNLISHYWLFLIVSLGVTFLLYGST